MNTIERIEARLETHKPTGRADGYYITVDELAAIKAVVESHRKLCAEVMGFTHDENYRVSKSNENAAFVDYRDLAVLRGTAMQSAEALSKLEN